MGNFKHLPESPRICVIEPVRRTTHTYREEAIIKSGMNPFLLDGEDVFIDLLTDSGTGTVTQSTQAAMMRGGEAYSGSRSYYALAESVKNIFGYQYIIPTHQDHGAEQIYIPVLIKRREQEKGLDRNKVVVFSNYFLDTIQGRNQINDCTVCNVYIKEAFDTGMRCDSRGGLDLEGLERGIEEVDPSNVPYIAATVTSNSAGGQPASLVNLKAMYSIVKKYDIPVVMGSARFAEDVYFVRQREAEYKDWTIEQTTCETYRYVDMPAMSIKKDAMMPMGGPLCVEGDNFFDVYTECRTLCAVREGFPIYGGLEGGAIERLMVGLYDGMNLDWPVYRITQVQYLVDGLEEIGVTRQQAGGHAAFADTGKLLPRIPADQFPAQVLACELYKVADVRAVEIGSFLLGRDPKTGKQLPRPAELLRLTIPRVTYVQTHMDFITGASKHVKRNAANIKGLTLAYGPRVLHHFTARPKEV